MWSNKKVRIVVIIALGISLFSGVSIVAVKSVTYLQVERKKQKRVESLKEASRQVKARQKIALWVVQHYDG
ncbi:hypothetical protein [Ligilactobacillus apodemi]|uniref:hypothetical protein n=1 Tax=Ligilactobacillus apodemi TaxID=307126 RepID=UPI00046A9F95|nr:hypothetical protein [Ligilactobacillus apodemi]